MLSIYRFSNYKKPPIGLVRDKSSHDGIKTIEAVKSCSFSRKSDLCIRIITWNMNGKVHT